MCASEYMLFKIFNLGDGAEGGFKYQDFVVGFGSGLDPEAYRFRKSCEEERTTTLIEKG
jgi:hypothetical protein